jgi:hypothetical protein
MEEQILDVDEKQSAVSARVCNLSTYFPSICTPLIITTALVSLSHAVCAELAPHDEPARRAFSQWILQ